MQIQGGVVMNLGQFIKQKRLEKNLTMEQLGNSIGKNKAFISRLENNKVKTLKNDVIEPLATALGVPVIALFEGFDENGNKKDNVEQVSPREFVYEVKELLDKTINLTEQQKQHLLHTLEFVCTEEE
jgi:transcriptional regulator with XRE-family HTH domain